MLVVIMLYGFAQLTVSLKLSRQKLKRKMIRDGYWDERFMADNIQEAAKTFIDLTDYDMKDVLDIKCRKCSHLTKRFNRDYQRYRDLKKTNKSKKGKRKRTDRGRERRRQNSKGNIEKGSPVTLAELLRNLKGTWTNESSLEESLLNEIEQLDSRKTGGFLNVSNIDAVGDSSRVVSMKRLGTAVTGAKRNTTDSSRPTCTKEKKEKLRGKTPKGSAVDYNGRNGSSTVDAPGRPRSKDRKATKRKTRQNDRAINRAPGNDTALVRRKRFYRPEEYLNQLPGESYILYCDKDLSPMIIHEEVTYRLCSACRAVRDLTKEYFPRYFNQVICSGARACLNEHGDCIEQNLSFIIFKNIGTVRKPDWKKVSINVPISCECMMSMLSPYVDLFE